MTANPNGDELPGNAAAPDSFIDKWLARWPEWAVAQVFVPAHQRRALMAWAALQQELGDAAWGGADPRPGEAKLGWWQEELHGWSRGLRRHPLGVLLQPVPTDWQGLAAALPTWRDSRARPVDAHEALGQLEAVAVALARVDADVEGGAPSSPWANPAPAASMLVLQQLLHARLAVAGDAAVPLQDLARGEGRPAGVLWARRVPTLSPGHAVTPGGAAPVGTALPSAAPPVPRFRRITAHLALHRLAQGDATRPLAAWRSLAIAWKAARN